MKYVGSKNKLKKELIPIIQNYIDNNNIEKYLEPFVGGANVIDKIKCNKKVGCDVHEELIELLKHVQNNGKLPETITEDEYIKVRDNRADYPKWHVGLVGFCATFGSKYFGGYARAFKNDKVTPRDMPNEAIRNIEKQRKDLTDISLVNISFLDIPKDKIKDYLIYCDIPYKNTTKYKTETFPYEKFYDWVKKMSKDNIVLISEYNMPNDFECIWQKEHKILLDKDKGNQTRIEKLFIYKGEE